MFSPIYRVIMYAVITLERVGLVKDRQNYLALLACFFFFICQSWCYLRDVFDLTNSIRLPRLFHPRWCYLCVFIWVIHVRFDLTGHNLPELLHSTSWSEPDKRGRKDVLPSPGGANQKIWLWNFAGSALIVVLYTPEKWGKLWESSIIIIIIMQKKQHLVSMKSDRYA